MEALQPLLDYLKNPETPFGVPDVFYGIYLLYGLIRGLFRGLPEELSQLLGTVLVFTGAHFLYPPVSRLIIANTRLESPEASTALAYLLMVLLFLIAWKLLTLMLRKALDWTCPKQIHRLGGAVLGTVKNAVILCVILTLVVLSGHKVLTDSLVENSAFGRATQRWIPDTLREHLPALFPAREPPSPQEEPPDGPGDA